VTVAPPSIRIVILIVAVAGLLGGLLPAASAHAAQGPPERPGTRQVMFVGNNWDGTADIIDARTFERLDRINIIPDKEERMAEIRSDPERLAFFLAIQQGIGKGHNQYVDDMFSTHDGELVAVSRPSFADVVGIDLETEEIVWRFEMEGQRTDHMAVSPDGETLLVSDSTANVGHELDIRTGEKTGEFPSGDSPHESVYTADGEKIIHASIGRVYTPTDRSEIGAARSTSKGKRFFQIVDADSLEVEERVNMGNKLEEAGYPDMSAAVRPLTLSPDEKTVYLQVSFHHGFVEYDLANQQVVDVAELPISEAAENTPEEQYLLDSAHHGMASKPDGSKLCVAGTVSNYAAIVDPDGYEPNIVSKGAKPYWSTTGADGEHCWVSYSGDNEVAVVDYETEEEVARIPVGFHPQRVRVGVIRNEYLDPTERVGGRSRLETARLAAAETYPDGADTVVLGRADDYADALTGGPLSAHLNAPLMLTARDGLSSETAGQIADLGASNAVLLGGPEALSPQVAEDLQQQGVSTRRVAGPSRYATAAAVAEELPDSGEVFVAEGDDPDPSRGFPDAVSASGIASTQTRPVLLATTDTLPPATAQALEGGTDATIVGGPTAISDDVAGKVDQNSAETTRLAGANRYATSAAVAEEAVARGISPATTWAATGRDFPDALVAGAAAGSDNGLLVLVDGQNTDGAEPVRQFLSENASQIETLKLAGDYQAITRPVEQRLLNTLGQG
jgi:YVTN family beta-propeller protein